MTPGDTTYVEGYRDLLDNWANEVSAQSRDISIWDMPAFWTAVNTGRSTPIPLNTKAFVDSWLTAVSRGNAHDPATSTDLRRLITDRERVNKGEQSRLNNDRLLKEWSGASGAGRLTYRWSTVQTMVGDIKEGLDRATS